MSTASEYPALVLNANFLPLRTYPLSTWTFERTLRNVLKGDRVTVVSEYDVTLRSPKWTYRPPSVIALREFRKVPQDPPFCREAIALRDDLTCQYCGTRFDTMRDHLTFDHVLPRSQGNSLGFLNTVLACVPCNQRKADRTDMKPLRAPYKPTAQELARKRRAGAATAKITPLDWAYWLQALDP